MTTTGRPAATAAIARRTRMSAVLIGALPARHEPASRRNRLPWKTSGGVSGSQPRRRDFEQNDGVVARAHLRVQYAVQPGAGAVDQHRPARLLRPRHPGEAVTGLARQAKACLTMTVGKHTDAESPADPAVAARWSRCVWTQIDTRAGTTETGGERTAPPCRPARRRPWRRRRSRRTGNSRIPAATRLLSRSTWGGHCNMSARI